MAENDTGTANSDAARKPENMLATGYLLTMFFPFNDSDDSAMMAARQKVRDNAARMEQAGGIKLESSVTSRRIAKADHARAIAAGVAPSGQDGPGNSGGEPVGQASASAGKSGTAAAKAR